MNVSSLGRAWTGILILLAAIIPLKASVALTPSRPTKTLVGAIRWDAWVNPRLPWGGQTADKYIGAQVARNLSPSQYHYRLPYFGIVESKDRVTLPDYTQKTFDEEMRYAKEAGIDYFMYCWYKDDDPMSAARKFHAASKYRNDVKMTGMWEISTLTPQELAEDIGQLKQSYWQKVGDGRPLVYLYQAQTQTVEGVAKFRQACIAAGLKNPYLVGFRTFGFQPDLAKKLGVDALSDYALGGGVPGGQPYSTLMNDVAQQWGFDKGGVSYIPLVPTGWDRRPRIDNPVTWEGPTPNDQKTDYFQPATPQEIAQTLQKALDFNRAHPEQNQTNSVLIYAWNEHDEGGWLCPTIIDAGGGFPQKRTDATNARDTRRLQAIQQVLRPGARWKLDKDIDLKTAFTHH